MSLGKSGSETTVAPHFAQPGNLFKRTDGYIAEGGNIPPTTERICASTVEKYQDIHFLLALPP